MDIFYSFEGLISIFVILTILAVLLLKRIHQPYIISYILVGVLLGEHGFHIIADEETVIHLGEIGIILLLFFIGMEISLPEFVKQWKVALIGTLLQVLFSVSIVYMVGSILDWGINRSVIIGFVISLSSSAVIVKLLEEKKIINSKLGKNVLSILLTQDILIVPMLIIASFMGGTKPSSVEILLLLLGGVFIILILAFIYIKKSIVLPFSKSIQEDYELQVFVALLFCFGGALLSSLFGLSAGLGAFVGGMVMHAGKATEWIHDNLHPFRVLFVAIFFVSLGLQIDIEFIAENLLPLSIILLAIFVTNHFLNSVILRIFNCTWREALLGGALLAQIGEMSFLLSYSAYDSGIILTYGYKFSVSLICLTLVFSPFWIGTTQALIGWRKVKLKEN